MLLKHVDREWLPLGDRWLAIHAPTGAWLLLDKICEDIVSVMEAASSMEEVFDAFPDIPPARLVELLRALEESELRIQESISRRRSESENEAPPILAVVKMAEGCNLNCSYCYIEAGTDKKRKMDAETARRIFDAYLALHENDGLKFNYSFHGGEPLLNFKLIREMTAYAAPCRDRVMLSIQTNGTLITDEIARFFKENHVNVGVSIDGPKEFHDRTRHYKNGAGSFEQTMRGIRLLQKHGVHVGIIAVLNGENTRHMDEMMDFFLENRLFDLSFSPIQKNGRGKDDSNSFLDGDTLFDAYRTLLDRIVSHNRTHPKSEWATERVLTNLMKSIYLNQKPFMCMNAPCGAARRLLGFDVEGNFYACDNFINDRDFKIGSMGRGGIPEQLVGSEVREKAARRCMENLARCRDCVWRGLCGGICYSADYYSGARGVGETEVCAFYKKMIPYLIQRIDEDPELPLFVDWNIKNDPPRSVFLSLDGIDRELLEAIIKVHKITPDASVYLCASRADGCPELPELLALLREKGLTYHMALLSDDAAAMTPDGYRVLADSGVQALQIDFSRLNDPVQAAKRLFDCRRGQKNKIPLLFSASVDSNVWRPSFMDWVCSELMEQDKIILSPPCGAHDDERLLNPLLEAFSQSGLAKHIVLASVAGDRLWKSNLTYLLRQTDQEQKYLWISRDSLAGEELEAPPFAVL